MQAVWNDSLTFCIFWWFCPDGQPRSTATTLLLPRLKRRGREQSMPERKRLTAWGKDDSIKAERMRQTNKQASKGHAEAKRVGKEQSCCTSHQWATLSQELIFSPVKKKLVIRWHLKYMQNNNNNKWICPWELLSVMDQQELWLLLDHSPAWSQPITSTRVKALNTAPKNYRKRAGFTEKKKISFYQWASLQIWRQRRYQFLVWLSASYQTDLVCCVPSGGAQLDPSAPQP